MSFIEDVLRDTLETSVPDIDFSENGGRGETPDRLSSTSTFQTGKVLPSTRTGFVVLRPR